MQYLFVEKTVNATVIMHYLDCQDGGIQGFSCGWASNCK